MTKNTIAFVAGKSGGHIVPCLALAEQYLQKQQDTNVLFFSSNLQLDKNILANNPLVSHHITIPLWTAQSRSFYQKCAILWDAFYSFLMSMYYLLKHRPSKLITTGGVVALPVCIAAYVLRIPVTLYSLDAVPGKAIQWLSPLASRINICFKNSQRFFKSYACTVAPFPLRYTNGNAHVDKKMVMSNLGFDDQKKTVLVLGGSQGSSFLNECIKKWIYHPSFLPNNIQIIHQTGAADFPAWRTLYKEQNINAHVFSYNPHLSELYSVADIIICRAGAGTLFEAQFFNKKCLVIPLRTHTTSHQVDNAQSMAQEHPDLFYWIDQRDIEQEESILYTKLNELLVSVET